MLSWQDDFDTLDTSAWQLQTFTFGGNEAQFTPQNATVANGILTISLTPNPNSTTEPYWGVEMRSAKTLTYGKVSARMRFATGSGVVSGLVLFYTPYPNCNWNEIDIEHLGDSSNTLAAQLPGLSRRAGAELHHLGVPDAGPRRSSNLGVNAETDFHQYDIEWTPAGVKTYIDGDALADLDRARRPSEPTRDHPVHDLGLERRVVGRASDLELRADQRRRRLDQGLQLAGKHRDAGGG